MWYYASSVLRWDAHGQPCFFLGRQLHGANAPVRAGGKSQRPTAGVVSSRRSGGGAVGMRDRTRHPGRDGQSPHAERRCPAVGLFGRGWEAARDTLTRNSSVSDRLAARPELWLLSQPLNFRWYRGSYRTTQGTGADAKNEFASQIKGRRAGARLVDPKPA